MSNNEKNPKQIYRFDGKAKFCEVINAFSIDKVMFGFRTYDQAKEIGKRITGEIDIYVDIPVFLALSHDVLTGKIDRDLKNNPNQPAFVDMGGVSADNLRKRKIERSDKMSMSRQLKIGIGKSGILFQAECGPGRLSDTGLIVPAYNGNPEQKIIVPIKENDLKAMVRIIEFEIQGYISSKYTIAEIDARKAAKNSQNQAA